MDEYEDHFKNQRLKLKMEKVEKLNKRKQTYLVIKSNIQSILSIMLGSNVVHEVHEIHKAHRKQHLVYPELIQKVFKTISCSVEKSTILLTFKFSLSSLFKYIVSHSHSNYREYQITYEFQTWCDWLLHKRIEDLNTRNKSNISLQEIEYFLIYKPSFIKSYFSRTILLFFTNSSKVIKWYKQQNIWNITHSLSFYESILNDPCSYNITLYINSEKGFYPNDIIDIKCSMKDAIEIYLKESCTNFSQYSILFSLIEQNTNYRKGIQGLLDNQNYLYKDVNGIIMNYI